MNANVQVKWFVRCLSVMIALTASPLLAAGSMDAGCLPVLSLTLGQLGFGGGEARKEAETLLKQARVAMSQKNFEEAEKSLAKAEKLGVKYDLIAARMYDTPEKVRKDLAAAKAPSAPAEPKKGATAPPSLLGGSPREATPLPASTAAGRANTDEVINAMTDVSKAKAKQALEAGRKALEQGNLVEAQAAFQKANTLKATFAANEYSPAQLAADLQKAGVNVGSQPPAATVASPFMLRPSDIEAEDSARVPSPKRPTFSNNLESAFGSPETNPNKLPTATNARGDLQAKGNNSPAAGGDFAAAEAGTKATTLPQRLPGLPSEKAELQRLKAEAMQLSAQAKAAQDRGDLENAARLIDQAQSLNVPDSLFGQGEMRPWQLMLEINKEITRRNGNVQQASLTDDVLTPGSKYPVARGVYNPEGDATRNQQVQAESPLARPPGPPAGAGSLGENLLREGNRALEAQDRVGALKKYQEAWQHVNELDPVARQQLKDKLSYLRSAPATLPTPDEATGIAPVDSEQQVRAQKLMREVTLERAAAERLANENPKEALNNLKNLRDRVSAADLDPANRRQLLVIVDRSLKDLETYIERNRGDIDLKERNTAVKEDLARERELTGETQNKVAGLVDRFNNLMDERRYAEAEVIAKQVRELMPTSSIAEMLSWKSSFAKNWADQTSIADRKSAGFVGALGATEEAAIPTDDRIPYQHGNLKDWRDLTARRRKMLDEFNRKLSPAEMDIQKSLAKMVEVNFENRPLSEVMDTLSKMAGINIHLDPQGLHAEAVTSDTPVSLKLTNPIMLKSALTLLLSQLRLSYVIENEVLKITSQEASDSHVITQVYYVADLVTPIPNFVPSYNIGLPGAIRESFNAMGYGGPGRGLSSIPLTVNKNEMNGDTNQNNSVLAQMGQANMFQHKDGSQIQLPMPSSQGTRGSQSVGNGPGGLGGGVQADFDTLIELVTSTISPDSWLDNGGKGTISGFPTNLSLVVSQTQDIHQDIADLLQQLRRLQDLQVTIEVRFIALNDNFFERIGVDFTFNVDDNTGLNINNPNLPDDNGRSYAFGLDAVGNPTNNLDFQYRANTRQSTIPTFGGFDAASAANFGFAILSDIEVFFLLTALQGDTRTNVLQAPKVTLFNGQQAFVRDSTDRPFVTQIIPVVGDFAAAHQPVVTVLSEGTSLSVQAVVSGDRRFVRLTLVPFFTKIGNVETFTFNGKTTSNTGTTVQDPTDPTKKITNGSSTTTEGTTVQLPSLAVTTVSTTVSVPDGGTIVLGGVKRLQEGRNERGVPLLGKIPYVSRLFKNVGIGRNTQSLMMMVTPRIIIQEEEEANLGLGPTQ